MMNNSNKNQNTSQFTFFLHEGKGWWYFLACVWSFRLLTCSSLFYNGCWLFPDLSTWLCTPPLELPEINAFFCIKF